LYLVPDVSNSNSLLTGVSFYLHERAIFTVGGAEFSSDVFEPFRPFGTIKHYVDGVFFFISFPFNLSFFPFSGSVPLSPTHTHFFSTPVVDNYTRNRNQSIECRCRRGRRRRTFARDLITVYSFRTLTVGGRRSEAAVS